MNWVTSFSHLLQIIPLALFPMLTPTLGKNVVLAKAGGTAELPCTISQKKSLNFVWHRPPDNNILKSHNSLWTTGPSRMKNRVESKKSLWDQGSFPLIIKQLEMEDSGGFSCEVDGKKLEVDLMVFRVNSPSSIRKLSGQSLTLTLEAPAGQKTYSVVWKDPQNTVKTQDKTLSLAKLELKHSGIWKCTVTQDSKQLEFQFRILVLGFLDFPTTVYGRNQEKVVFTFPTNFDDESLQGTLRWQPEGSSYPETQVKFSWDKKVSMNKSFTEPKFLMLETAPLSVILHQVKPEHAGSGNLSLHLGAKGVLWREVKLVVMKVSQLQNNLLCEVWGPTAPNVVLSLKLRNKTMISRNLKQVKMENPEGGTWQCQLHADNILLLDYELEVTPTALGAPILAMVMGSVSAFLILTGLCIFCCIKCWHRRRQAERMSQIKRLLREKKTCQCSHRFQKM